MYLISSYYAKYEEINSIVRNQKIKGLEEKVLKRRHTVGQQMYFKVFSTTNHQVNANQTIPR